MKICRALLVGVLFLNIYGCSLLNTLFDDHKVFLSARNSEVGERLDWVLKYSKHYYFYSADNTRTDSYSKKYQLVSVGDLDEYSFEHGGDCKWVLIVDKASGNIRDWRFVEGFEECGYKRFYEGAF